MQILGLIRAMTAAGAFAAFCSAAIAGDRPIRNIMLTGYWPPSNEMLRPFSDNPRLNPDGWIGENWEGRGYNVYAYFPTFTNPMCTSCGQGMGDFEVDYQDTSGDFWPLVNALQPIAIVTASRTNALLSWELEMNQYNNDSWTPDYTAPLQPTPSPPDDSVPADFLRLSSLPMEEIIDEVNASGLGLDSFICFSQSAGAFLSGFMAYHGTWYQSLHDSPDDPAYCVAAGHIHVGRGIEWDVAHEATKISLRVLIEHVNRTLEPSDINGDGVVDGLDLGILLANWSMPAGSPGCGGATPCSSDLNADGVVDGLDLGILLANWTL